MTNAILIIAVSFGIKVMSESAEPKFYEITYNDGHIEHVIIDDNSQYICPNYCDIGHYHVVKLYGTGELYESSNYFNYTEFDEAKSELIYKGEYIRSVKLVENMEEQ